MLSNDSSPSPTIPVGHHYKDRAAVLGAIDRIDPRDYDKTRNHLAGAVTWLSPYITHGVIDTRTVANRVLTRHSKKSSYRLLFELAWREYFHRVWQEHEDAIFEDMRSAQEGVVATAIPQAMIDATTGIRVIDEGVRTLQTTGWMHNHLRMWVAGMICNNARTHWREPARWMHYHLLDGDLASNTLSWQWIAGTFSHKTYIANQDNLNKYSGYHQHDTFLDVDYDTLAELAIPDQLSARAESNAYPQDLPGTDVPLSFDEPISLRSIWNLNPVWEGGADARPVVFIEEKHFDDWPMAPHRWAFVQHWINDLGALVWKGCVDDLIRLQDAGCSMVREEYPACTHWPGTVIERQFLFGVPDKPYSSFSSFWKAVR